MGCCEPNKVLNFNNRTEIQTRFKNTNNDTNNNNNINYNSNNKINFTEDNDEFIQLKLNHHNNNNNILFNSKRENDSEQSNQKDYYNNTDIPQTKSVNVPAMKIPLDIIQTKKQLQLTIYESKFLPEGRTLTINPGGLVGSERNAQDGVTKFGVNNVSTYYIYIIL